jgi:hypothetical protein
MFQTQLIRLRGIIPQPVKKLLRLFKLYYENDYVAPEIPQRQLVNCKIFQNRLNLICSITSKSTVAAEIGVLHGDFSNQVLVNTEITSLTLIDVDTSEIVGDVKSDKRVTIFEGLSTDFTQNVLFDWIYIDGDHSYSGVTNDIKHYQELLKPGGYMVFNDYCKINPRSLGKFGVHDAVNDFIADSGWNVYALALQPNCLYDIAIQKPT